MHGKETLCWQKQINTTLLALTARCVYCWERDVDDEIVGGQLGFSCGRVSFRQAMSVTHTGRLWAKAGIRGEQEGRGAISEAAPPCKSKSSMLLTCTHLPKVKIIQKNKPFTLVNGSVRCIAAKVAGGKPSAAELKSKCCKSSCTPALKMASLTLRRFALTCWSGSEIIGSTKKIIKRQKHQRAQIATVIAAAGWAGCSVKCVWKKKETTSYIPIACIRW